jgi:enamine deaminase RidA (YjgF/YER057c/UK114 family)
MDARSPDPSYISTPAIWRVPTFSTAVVAPSPGRRVFLSAQSALDAEGRVAVEGDARRQIDETFANLRRILDGAGLKPEHIVRVMHFFVEYEVDVLKTLFRNLSETFPADRMPASTGIAVAGFAQPGLKYQVLAEGFLPAEPAAA